MNGTYGTPRRRAPRRERRPWRTRRRRAARPCDRSCRRRRAPSSCPRWRASLIGACLHTPHVEHGQQRSSCGNTSSTGREVDGVREHGHPQRRAHLVDVEPEPVRHHRDLGSGGPQRGDERLEPGIERHLARDRPQRAPRRRGSGAPLVEHALAAPDLAAPVPARDRATTRALPTRSRTWTPTSRVLIVPSKSRNTDVRRGRASPVTVRADLPRRGTAGGRCPTGPTVGGTVRFRAVVLTVRSSDPATSPPVASTLSSSGRARRCRARGAGGCRRRARPSPVGRDRRLVGLASERMPPLMISSGS